MMNNVGCWNRFDYVFLLTCVGYKYRIPYIENEFKRVGIKKWIPIIDVDTPVKDIVRKGVTTSNFLTGQGPFSCLMNHYKAMKTALGLGANTCLIIEDDTAFLKDVGKLADIVRELPADFDVAQFSHVKPMPMSDEDYYSSLFPLDMTRYWMSFTKLRDNGCYALSKKAMQTFVDAIEKGLRGSDTIVANDCYIDRFTDLRKVACFPNAAVQNLFPSRNSSDHTYWDRLRALDSVNLDDYNLSLTRGRVFVFTNVFRYSDDVRFNLDFKMLELTPRDTVIFMNKAIPLRHLQNWEALGGADVVTIHRIHTLKDGSVEWFGEVEIRNLLQEKSVSAKSFHLDNEGILYDVDDAVVGKLPFGDNYPEGKYPTTGFLSLQYAFKFGNGDVVPVNFFGEDDNSTGKYFMHAWEFEDKYVRSLPNRVFLQCTDTRKVPTANTGSPVIRKGYNLYRKPSLAPKPITTIAIPSRYRATPMKRTF